MSVDGEALQRNGARRYHGGHLDGIRAAVERGYFEELEVDVIWLSPLNDNPEGRFLGRDGEEAEAYHGYWAKSPRDVENRFGTEASSTLSSRPLTLAVFAYYSISHPITFTNNTPMFKMLLRMPGSTNPMAAASVGSPVPGAKTCASAGLTPSFQT